jgi:hypothetical protein
LIDLENQTSVGSQSIAEIAQPSCRRASPEHLSSSAARRSLDLQLLQPVMGRCNWPVGSRKIGPRSPGDVPVLQNHTINFMLRAMERGVNDWQKQVAHFLGRKNGGIFVP